MTDKTAEDEAAYDRRLELACRVAAALTPSLLVDLGPVRTVDLEKRLPTFLPLSRKPA